jgi:hypothetical protein
MLENIKLFLADDRLFYSIVIILVAVVSFGLGRLSVEEQQLQSDSRVTPLLPAPLPTTTVATVIEVQSVTSAEMTYVASKNGTKYHLPNCPGVKQMSEQNKLYFSSKNEAEAAGYTPAANCPGL